MITLRVTFKPNTSSDWAENKLLGLGLQGSDITIYEEAGVLTSARIKIAKEDELKYSRAIRMISPQVISVEKISRA